MIISISETIPPPVPLKEGVVMATHDTGGAAHPGRIEADDYMARDPRAEWREFRDSGDSASWPGMTLLDWFAGQALAGIAAFMEADRSCCENDSNLAERTSRYAYDIAAAMVAEKYRREAPDE